MEITYVDHKQLKALRIQRKMSMQDLHDKTGITIMRIFEIEYKGNPKPQELSKIIEVLQGGIK